MIVIKRDGSKEPVKFDKVLNRVGYVAEGLKVDGASVAQTVVSGLYDGIKSSEIDTYLAETAAVKSTEHPDYGKLAAKIAITNLHKQTTNFYHTMKNLYKAGVVSHDYIKIVKRHNNAINQVIDYNRDLELNYFGFKTLERSYLLKIDGKVVERPQHLFMRVALSLAGDDINDVIRLYDLMSQGFYTHATPTLFNAGTPSAQMSSCFLVAMEDDSLKGIYRTLAECADISKYAGGIGLHISNVRAKGSRIKGTNGVSDGIVKMLKVFDTTAAYVNQGGKRKGSIAVYIEPWHADIEQFLVLRKNTTKDELATRDLSLALWTPDLFMKRVEADGMWSLMSQDDCPGLTDTYGEDFEKLYEQYESEGKFRKQMRARDLMVKIMESQIETGYPYMLYKDAANRKSNQSNIGVIKSSNLCCEIMEVSTPTETAVCNLASIGLPRYVKTKEDGSKYFDFELLHDVSKFAIKNLNRVIDLNYYPTTKTEKSNNRHRPVGLGVQGFADVLLLLELPFESNEAKELNKMIFETMYHASVESSIECSMEHAKKVTKEGDDINWKSGAYETFEGSPISQGIFQFDMWNVKPSDRYDWDALRARIKQYGVRNSLLLAPMPTASTAQIFDNFEAFEALTSNLYKREVLAGEFIFINKHLIAKLESLDLWNKSIRDRIIANNGSIQTIMEIPERIREVYKTVWEIPQRAVIDMSADRGPFICQSQSLNIHMANPNIASINSMHFYAWKKGLKTGMYYFRSKPAIFAKKVTVEAKPKVNTKTAEEMMVCSIDNPEACESCSG